MVEWGEEAAAMAPRRLHRRTEAWPWAGSTLGTLGSVVSTMKRLEECIVEDALVEVIALLVEHPTLANVPFASGLTPLTMAASQDLYDVAHYLLDHGADTNQADMCGCAPLFRAVQMSHPDMVQLLLDHGANPLQKAAIHQTTPLMAAAWQADTDIVAQLVVAIRQQQQQQQEKSGAADDGDWLNDTEHSGCTALWLAAEAGQADNVRTFLEMGADFLRVNKDGLLPRHMAQFHGHVQVRWLLEGAEKRYRLEQARAFQNVAVGMAGLDATRQQDLLPAARSFLPPWAQARLANDVPLPSLEFNPPPGPSLHLVSSGEGVGRRAPQQVHLAEAVFFVRTEVAEAAVHTLPPELFRELTEIMGDHFLV